MCALVWLSAFHRERVDYLRRTMMSTSELSTLMTLGSDDVALQKYLPELAKVALVMVRVLVVIRLIITAVTLTLPRAATSRRVPFRHHNTSGVGNPLARQMSIPSSKRDILVSTGSSNRMGFTGGVGRGGASGLQQGSLRSNYCSHSFLHNETPGRRDLWHSPCNSAEAWSIPAALLTVHL